MQNKIWLWLVTLVLVVGLTACQGEESNNNESTNEKDQATEQENSEESSSTGFESVTLTDKSGTDVTIDEKPEKIVSVIPSATEIVFSVGAGNEVVGVSQWANYPEEVQDIEK